jgi:glycosyltransferase involved in cell wall biosynthesis
VVSAAISHLPSPISGDSPLDVLLVTRACTEHYPPTVNQANLLAGRGLSVGILDLAQAGVIPAVDPAVRRWRSHTAWNSKQEAPRSFFRRCADALSFLRACRRIMDRERPKVILAYDIHGSAVVPPGRAAYQTVYHFHEYPEAEPGMSMGTRWALRKAHCRSPNADLVVFPDPDRAALFQEVARLPVRPRVVMNCPRRMDELPASPLRQQLALNTQHSTFNLQPSTQVVCYLGSIGINQGLIPAAQSMRYWPPDSVFVLVGASSPSVEETIRSHACTAGATSRILFLGPRPHAEALALTAGADLGLALIGPIGQTKNFLYSSGAVNKRFEYMALGVPQLTNAGPGLTELIERTGCGVCVNTGSPEAIGRRVCHLLTNSELRHQMAANARRRHLDTFNYEYQFEPVLNWIQAAVNGQ